MIALLMPCFRHVACLLFTFRHAIAAIYCHHFSLMLLLDYDAAAGAVD